MAETKKKNTIKGKRTDAYRMDPNDIVLVGGNGPNDVTKKAGPTHLFDRRVTLPLDESMVLNIMRYSVKTPVLVTKIGPDAYCVDGRQRVRCAREANRRLVAEGKQPWLVPVMPQRGADHMLFGVMISTNEHRQDDGPITLAGKMSQFIDDLGRSMEEAEVAFGKSAQQINNYLKLLELHPKVQKMMEDGNIPASFGPEIENLPQEEQLEKVNELLASGVKPTTRNIRKNVGTKPLTPPKRAVKKIVDSGEYPEVKDDSFWAGVLWMMGRLSTEDAGGGLLKAMEEAQKPKPKVKKEKKNKKTGSKKETPSTETPTETSETPELPDNVTQLPSTTPPTPTIAKKKGAPKTGTV